MAAAAAAAGGLTSITTEPLFYGPVLPPGVDAARTPDCALSAEEFLKLMTTVRTRFYAADDTAAIARVVGNLRGTAASWYDTRINSPAPGTDAELLRTNWNEFCRVFKLTWFKQRSRWDTSTSYLELKQLPNEPAWMLLERILVEYRRDQELARIAIDTRIATIDNRGTADQLAVLAALADDQRNAINAIIANARSDTASACLESMRDADVSRALALSCSDDRLRKAIRRKAAEGLDYNRLSTFVRTEEDSLRTRGSQSASHPKPRSNAAASSASSHTSRRRNGKVNSAEAAEVAPADDANDASAPEDNDEFDDALQQQFETVVSAIRSRFPRRRRPEDRDRDRDRRPASPSRPRDSRGRFSAYSASPAPAASASAVSACSTCTSSDHTSAACPSLFATVEAIVGARLSEHPSLSSSQPSGHSPFSMTNQENWW